MSDASPSNEVSNNNNLYENNPDTGKINVVFANIIEKNLEKEINVDTSTSGTTDGGNTIITDTEIGEFSTDGIQIYGCVVMPVAVFVDRVKYEKAKATLEQKGKETETGHERN